MTSPIVRATSRRHFLQYLAASPLLASGAMRAFGMEAPSKLPDPMIWAPPGSGDLINSPKDAINVFDFEPVARKNVSAGAFRIYGFGHRRRGHAARQPRGFPQIPAHAASPQRRLQGRHLDRAVRHEIRFADLHMPDRRQPVLSPRWRTRRGKSRARRQSSANAVDVLEF